MKMLEQIQTGMIERPQRVILYAPEGIGKSTLAAQFPKPLFLDTEEGTHHLDVARLNIKNWGELLTALDELEKNENDFQTVVIDTIDWAEQLAIVDMIAKDNAANKKIKSIEDYGFGKGYIFLRDKIQEELLPALNALMKKGKNILLVAHSQVKRFELPDTDGFDRYELKLERKTCPILKEWADLILFGNWQTRVVERDGKNKGILGGGKRILYTTRTAAWDAKNRHNLADNIEWNWAAIADCFPVASPDRQLAVAKKSAPKKQPSATQTKKSPLNEKITAWMVKNEERVNMFMRDKNLISEHETWRNANDDIIARIDKNFAGFQTQVLG